MGDDGISHSGYRLDCCDSDPAASSRSLVATPRTYIKVSSCSTTS